jgi:hypothetical protein
VRIFISLLFVAAFPPPVFAQAPHVFGAWTLNADDSIYPGALPESQVRMYIPLEDEFYVGLAVTIDGEGNASFLQFTAKTDGQDYPEYDVFNYLSGTRQVSPDGTRLTIFFSTPDENGNFVDCSLVYGRQGQ